MLIKAVKEITIRRGLTPLIIYLNGTVDMIIANNVNRLNNKYEIKLFMKKRTTIYAIVIIILTLGSILCTNESPGKY
jgi:hypothetical protein